MILASILLHATLLATPPQDPVHMKHPEAATSAGERSREATGGEKEKPRQAEESAGAMTFKLSSDEMARLDELSRNNR